MSYYESHWFTPPDNNWERRYYQGTDPVQPPNPVLQMDAIRGLLRAKGLIGTHRHWLRTEAFNQRQKQCRGPIMDIRFTVIGTKLNQQR